MINGILTFKDIDEVIDHCNELRNSHALKQFIDGILKANSGDPSLSLSIAERIVVRFPNTESFYIEVPPDTDWDRGIILFDNYKEEYSKKEASQQVVFMYEYLLFSFLNQDSKRENCILRTNLTPKELEVLFNKLKDNGFCYFSNYESIQWIFSEDHIGTERIEWTDLASRSKQVNFQTLYLLLYQILKNPTELKYPLFRNKLIDTFMKKGGNTLDGNNIKKTLNDFLRNVESVDSNKNKTEREALLVNLINIVS